MSKPTVCIDFDGVVHSYTSGWTALDVAPDPPVPGAFDAIRRFLDDGWQVAIFSSRSASPFGLAAMRNWLTLWATAEDLETGCGMSWTQFVTFPQHKPPATISIDDRGLTFDGDWSQFVPASLRNFVPWNKR